MDWHFTDDRPIWQQLTEQLTLRILKGEYPPGGKLPAVREIAAQAGVNPNTMQRAMAQLEQDGLAVANRTAGRTVTEDAAVIQAARRARASAACPPTPPTPNTAACAPARRSRACGPSSSSLRLNSSRIIFPSFCTNL